MALPTGSMISALKRVGTNQKIRWLLAIILPMMERMKSPSLRILMTSIVPRLMETSFRFMTPEDKRAVLHRFEALLEEHRSNDGERTTTVPTS